MPIQRHFANSDLAEMVDISNGMVINTDFIHKFGRNPNIGGAPETIWMNGGIYTYLDAPSTVYVTSNSADDAAAGTGARTVTVQGLDNNYEQVEETLTVGGPVSTIEFLRIFRAFVETAGSIKTNVGNVKITTGAGGTGTVLADIGIIGTGTTFGLGQTQLALYTIPAHCTGYLTRWNNGVGAYNSSATITLLTRQIEEVTKAFRTRDIMDVPGGWHVRDYEIPIRLPPKTDVEIRAIASTGSNVSSSFDIVLVTGPGQ